MNTWQEVVKQMGLRGLAPKSIQIAQWNSWYIVSAFDVATSKCISESVAMGVSRNPLLACSKALTEFYERRAMKSSPSREAHITARSDGFAAYPSISQNYESLARENAILEAIERYLWAKWWDDTNTRFEILSAAALFNEFSQQLNLLQSEFKLNSVQVIKVQDSKKMFSLFILLAQNINGGVFTGGACLRESDLSNGLSGLFERAFGELLRHLIASKKMGSVLEKDLSFYEKRLRHFAGIGGQQSNLRLSKSGIQFIELPPLHTDSRISHSHPDLFCVHRCLFQGQPVFMGGGIERLCI